jgi:hypothetical protein
MTGPPEEQPVTDPNDDTQPQPQPQMNADAGAAAGAESAAQRAPIDGTGRTAAAEPAATGAPAGPPTPPLTAEPPFPPPPTPPPLTAKADRPADSGWREPAWFPPRGGDRHRARDRRPGPFAIVVGLILIAIGLYAFVDQTLGIALPAIHWSSLWPVLLIVVGGLILVRSMQRRP